MSLRRHLLYALGNIAEDSGVQAAARKIAYQVLEKPGSVDFELASAALPITAAKAGEAFYNEVLVQLGATLRARR